MVKTPTPPARRSFSTHFAPVAALLLGAGLCLAACGSDDTSAGNEGGSGGSGGKGGKGGSAGKAGSAGKGGSSGTAGKGGSGGSGGTGISLGGSNSGGSAGSAGSAAGGTAGTAGKAGSAGSATGGTAGAGGTSECAGPPGPIQKECRPATENECDGAFDKNPKFKPEGTTGNGFDDDCDGLVDEGCECPGAGSTKDCYLLPSSQTNGNPKFEPAGWCAANSKGKVACKLKGTGEFSKLQYDGQCIGAQGPKEEICEDGDFNCDGLNGNAADVCKCQPIVCPDPLYTTPFPDPNNIGQFSTTPDGPKTIQGVDGLSWFKNPDQAAKVTDWRWTLVGGPCDDILPNPTFAVFPENKGTPTVPWTSHLGLKTLNLPQVPDEGQPDPAFSNKASSLIHRGWVIKGDSTPGKIFPAFSLSGDYYITGKFKYPNPANPAQLTEGQCTQVVKVRAPGLRVELCWPEVGPEQGDHDVDLHLARLQGNPSGDGKHGWFTTAGNAPNADDCYYSPNSACGNRFNASGPTAQTPKWYADEVTDEPGGVGVCHGWGSRRFDGTVPGTVSRPCASPRLDRDNITCNPAIEDPNAPEKDGPDPASGYTGQQGKNSDNFCGPENINLDAKVLQQGERFAIGVQCYDCVQGKNGQGGLPAHPRVNIYCNGEFKLGFGYDPANPDPNQAPALITEGQTYHGSFWNVATVAWNNDPNNPCTIEGGGSIQAGPEWNANDWRTKSNGSEFLCVQNGPLDSGGNNEAPVSPNTINWLFTPAGTYPDPNNTNALCAY